MKVSPKKPQLFKQILPGFKNGLKIPIGFLKYLKRHDQYEHAIIRRVGKKWLVKVNGPQSEDGNWNEFVEEHDLQLGDMLIFQHEGDMKFDVSSFDLSHCNKEYEEYFHEDEDEEADEKKDEEVATRDKPFGQSHFECILANIAFRKVSFMGHLKLISCKTIQEYNLLTLQLKLSNLFHTICLCLHTKIFMIEFHFPPKNDFVFC
ncbi:hypothetical protein CQW23_18836 [Capsicum baccatum]|uniref:TF-B3 domain-containing protein n=1 Tax=Capsicum baccatum TaxID=33114 RepID=A0A2G2W425_CAPBA|nr:hypothetical protein CQW23_18836 [Capsicum baccatum]